jgi:DNA polymerase (family 10)
MMNIQQMFEAIGTIEIDAAGNDVTKLRGTAAPRRWRGQKEPREYQKARVPYVQAFSAASLIMAKLREAGVTGQIVICGSLRRMRETIGDIDLAIEGDCSSLCHNILDSTDRAGTQLVSGVCQGLHVDLRFAPVESFGALCLHLTGSREFNISCREQAIKMGLSLSEHGLFGEGGELIRGDEDGILNALAMQRSPESR